MTIAQMTTGAVCLTALLSGCYTTTYATHRAPAGVAQEYWHHTAIAGLWEVSDPVRVDDVCPRGFATIKTEVSFVNGLAAAIVLACGFTAEAGFGHRHRHAAACDAAIEPGCSAFAPACAAEPGCAAFEPSCGFEPGCGAETVCPTNPCIKYRHKHAHRHKHGAGCCVEPTYETVLNPVRS